MINTFNIIGFIIIIIVVIIIETIQIYSCILLQIIICLVCFQEDRVMRGKSCDHSNNVAFCYFLSFFGPPMPCLYEEKLPTHLTELPSIVVSITVMIFFHIILHPAVLIYDFHIFTTSELPFMSQHFLHFLTKHGKKLVGLKGWPSLEDM